VPSTSGGARLAGRPWRACERVRGMSEGPQAPSESAGEGVANRCPDVTRSLWSYSYSQTRPESAGEDLVTTTP